MKFQAVLPCAHRVLPRIALLLIPLLTAPLLSAQDAKQPVVEMRDGGVNQVLQSIYIPVLLNAPFTAIVHTEWARPMPGGGNVVTVNQRRVARDSRGRLYEERWLLVPKDSGIESRMNVIQIADPDTHTIYNCLMLEKPIRCVLQDYTATASATYVPATGTTGPLANNAGYQTHEDLGVRYVEGLDCTGSRDVTTWNKGVFGNDRPVVASREFWHSAKIGINLISHVTGPNVGNQNFTVTDVNLAEPDPALFLLPPGSVVDDRRGPSQPER
jgi:hypothetical protein